MIFHPYTFSTHGMHNEKGLLRFLFLAAEKEKRKQGRFLRKEYFYE